MNEYNSMEIIRNCEKCKNIILQDNNSEKFTCGHIFCSSCLIKKIFLNHFTELSNQGQLLIKCTCQSGEKRISVENIRDMLASISEHQLRDDHIGIEKCSLHSAELKELYCLECQENVCAFCAIRSCKHSDHSLQQIEDYANHLRSQIPIRNSEEMAEYMKRIDAIAFNFHISSQTTLDLTVKIFDQIIAQLEECKEIYIDKMKQTHDRADIIIRLIKLIFSLYLQSMTTTYDVNLLQDLATIHSDLTEFNLQDETESTAKKLHAQTNELKDYLITLVQPIHATWSSRVRPWTNTLSLIGHSGAVNSLIQLKDGRIASASYDSTIKIWVLKAKDFDNTLTLTGHGDGVYSIIQLKDGRIASGSFDRTIKIWEIRETDYENMMTLIGHNNSVFTLIQLTDGRIASGSFDQTIKVWETKAKSKENENENDFENTLTLIGHTNYVWSLLQLKDGRIASGSCDYTIKIWELNQDDLGYNNILTLTGHNNSVYSLIQLKDGRIASGSFDLTIKVWEVSENDFKNTLTLSGHSGPISSLIRLKDARIASGSKDNTITIWEVNERDFKSILTLAEHSSAVNSLLQLKDGRIASGSWDTTIKVWEDV